MKVRSRRILWLVLVGVLVSSIATFAQELISIELPKPSMEGGRPLMEVLRDRQTQREFSSAELPIEVLSEILWAAFGVNRPESGKRTAPSAMNMQEISIYVALKRGLYVYDARKHTLEPVLEADVRGNTGSQPFVKEAPVNLVYVADYGKLGRMPEDMRDFYSACDTGFISQNVYLYCASEGLATVVRGLVDRETLAKAMKLDDDKKIILAQTIGYPKAVEKETEDKTGAGQ